MEWLNDFSFEFYKRNSSDWSAICLYFLCNYSISLFFVSFIYLILLYSNSNRLNYDYNWLSFPSFIYLFLPLSIIQLCSFFSLSCLFYSIKKLLVLFNDWFYCLKIYKFLKTSSYFCSSYRSNCPVTACLLIYSNSFWINKF